MRTTSDQPRLDGSGFAGGVVTVQSTSRAVVTVRPRPPGEDEEGYMNPPAFWSDQWWRWVLTIIIASVIAGLLIPAIRGVLLWAWRKTLQRPVILFVTKWTVGRHDCGHRSGSYAIEANGRRICERCHQAQFPT